MHQHQDDNEPHRLEYLDTFFASFLALPSSPETFRVFVELLDEAILQGEAVPIVESSSTRVLRTDGSSGIPPLRLFFCIEHGTMKFMFVGHYDENEP